MTGYKKYPHVSCKSVHLRLDRMLDFLHCHLKTLEDSGAPVEVRRECAEVAGELQKVIAYRGTVLFVQRRRGRFSGEYLAIR